MPRESFPSKHSNADFEILQWVDMMEVDDSDWFFLVELKDAVRSILAHCTITSPALGGRAKVGTKEVVEVLIWGRTWPPVEGETASTSVMNGTAVV